MKWDLVNFLLFSYLLPNTCYNRLVFELLTSGVESQLLYHNTFLLFELFSEVAAVYF